MRLTNVLFCVSFMAVAALAGSASAGMITESLTAPTTDVIAFADIANASGVSATAFKIGGNQNQVQHVGQSFRFTSPFLIDAVTVQYNSTVPDQFTFDVGERIRLNFTEDTDSDGTPDTIIALENYVMDNRTAQNFEYWTFTPTSAIGLLDANTTYGFMLEWRTTDNTNILRLERDTSNPYSNGGMLAQFNPTSLFPTPNANHDLTFYLQGQVIPEQVIPEPSTFLIWALGLLGLGWFGWRRRAA